MRSLWLLGSASVEINHSILKDAQENNSLKIPRFRSKRTVALLGYLVVQKRSVARDLLAALFWPDETSAKGRANLSRELHNLAQILPECWELSHQSVTFMPAEHISVDLYQLEKHASERHWQKAVEFLNGDFLEGLYLEDNVEFENWLFSERERWRATSELIFRRLIDGHIQRGRYTDGLSVARQLLKLAPWDEETHRHIMRFLVWSGQRGAALRQFESCKNILMAELGVTPSPETIYLYQQIQNNTVSLPPQIPVFLTEERARHTYERPLFVGRERELATLQKFLDNAVTRKGQVVFVTGGPGRGKTTLLEAFSQQAMIAHPGLLVVGGKCTAYSGLGDPYLPYREAMAMLTGDVEGRWDAGAISREHAQRLWASFPFAVQTVLDHGPQLFDVFVSGSMLLSRSLTVNQAEAVWLPQLQKQVKQSKEQTKELAQSNLFQQFTNVLTTMARKRPLLLILDDIQWADTASISLLFHLGRCLADANSRILIACAYRPEEVTHDQGNFPHPLTKVLIEFKRTFGNAWLDLGQTDEIENRQIVDGILDHEPNRLTKGFRNALYSRTRGHPLFTIELINTMQSKGVLRKDHDGVWVEGTLLDWDILPARIEAAIQERIDQLDSDLQQILSIASVEGQFFTAQVVAEVHQVPERNMLRLLSQDLEGTHRLIREQEDKETSLRRMARYQFRHALFQEYLYKRLGTSERRLLHRDVANALEILYEGQLEETAVQLAQHFHQAGEYEKALYYSSVAAERAAHIYANKAAIKHFTRAILLAEEYSLKSLSVASLYQGRGLVSEKLGDFGQAHNDYMASSQIAHDTNENEVEWQALINLGRLWTSRDNHQSRLYFKEALELARNLENPLILASSLNWQGNWHINGENPWSAIPYHQEALTLFKSLDNQLEMANTLDLLGMTHLLGGDLISSIDFYNQAVHLFQELEDPAGLAFSQLGRATTYAMPIFLTSAPVIPPNNYCFDFKSALAVASATGSAPDRAWAHWAFGLFYILNGRFGEALEISQNGLDIAVKIGHHEWSICNLLALGILYTELNRFEEALEHINEAKILAEELRSPHYIHCVGGALAKVHLSCGDLQPAQDCLNKVLSPKASMDTLGKRYCWVRQAELALLQNDPDLAISIVDRLITSAPSMLPGQIITFLWKLKGEALAVLGHQDKALVHLQEAAHNAQKNGEQFLLWRIHIGLGQIYAKLGQQSSSERAFIKAKVHINEIASTLHDETQKNSFLSATSV